MNYYPRGTGLVTPKKPTSSSCHPSHHRHGSRSTPLFHLPGPTSTYRSTTEGETQSQSSFSTFFKLRPGQVDLGYPGSLEGKTVSVLHVTERVSEGISRGRRTQDYLTLLHSFPSFDRRPGSLSDPEPRLGDDTRFGEGHTVYGVGVSKGRDKRSLLKSDLKSDIGRKEGE